MNDFVSLTKALEMYFNKQLNELPESLRNRVLMDFLVPWGNLSPDQRFNLAAQWDYLNDPATEQERQYWVNFFECKETITKDILTWQAISPSSPVGSELKKTGLAEFHKRLDQMEQQEKQARGDFYPDEPHANKAPIELTVGSPEWRTQLAITAANALHDKPGGSRDKKRQMQEFWASGKYTSRDICAEQECAALNMSFSAARNALKNTPTP